MTEWKSLEPTEEKGMLDRFLEDESTEMRLARTVAQGVIAATIVFVPTAIGWLDLSAESASFLTAAIMAVLSPVMALLRKTQLIEDEEE